MILYTSDVNDKDGSVGFQCIKLNDAQNHEMGMI